MKKIISILIGILLISSVGFLGACNKKFSGEPDYSKSEGKLQIGAWVSPPPSMSVPKKDDEGNTIKDANGDVVYVQTENFMTLERYQEIKDSGITTIYALYEPYAWNNQVIVDALDLAEKVGISYYVRDDAIWGLSEMTDEEIKNCKDFDYYKNKKAFKGHLVTDEPGLDKFGGIAELKPKYDKMFPNKDFYVNLFPTYASQSYLGTDYLTYIDEYLKQVKPSILSFDSYSLVQNAYGEASLLEDYLYNLEIVATKTGKAKTPFWGFIQSIGFGMSNRSPSSIADISFQVYTDLAYGAKGIQHFTYWTPLGADRGTSFGKGMIGTDGEKSPIYDYASAVNKEVQKFSNVLTEFEWESTLTNLGKNNTKNIAFNMLSEQLAKKLGKPYSNTHRRIKSISSSEDLICGTLKDKNGYEGFMAVNYTDPSKNIKNEITISFKDASKAVVYISGERQVVNLKNGKYTATLNSGEGQFIIPFN